MYSTCIHCHQKLDRNDAIEAFQVGTKLAFDSEKGRLWAICGSCARWNLTPIEERWEAVEQCERLFRAQKLRAQTDNIGLVRLPDSTELIRIGKPLRPEFAAWRYGREFSRRLHRRVAVVGGATIVIAGGVLALSNTDVFSAALLIPPVFIPLLAWPATVIRAARKHLIATRVIGAEGKPLRVVRANLEHTRLVVEPGAPIRLHLRHAYGHQDLSGDRAARAVSTLLAHINKGGAGIGTSGAAASVIMNAGDPRRAIEQLSVEARKRESNFEARHAAYARGDWIAAQAQASRRFEFTLASDRKEPINPGALHRRPLVQRLALEMALHEESERRAIEEEMQSLERDWREAEEIATIADDLLTPSAVTEKLTAAKERKGK